MVSAPSSAATDESPQQSSEETSFNNSSNKKNGKPPSKCDKCNKRLAREGCTQKACLNCCDDLGGCETHKKPRAQAELKEQILAGTTQVQTLAAAKRKLRIPPKSFFREPGFVYQGDTVIIWDIRSYVKDEKARDDAVRMSKRRRKNKKGDEVNFSVPSPLKNSRKRFRRIWEELVQTSLKEENVE